MIDNYTAFDRLERDEGEQKCAVFPRCGCLEVCPCCGYMVSRCGLRPVAMIRAPCPRVYVLISAYCRIVGLLKKQVAQFVLTASHFF